MKFGDFMTSATKDFRIPELSQEDIGEKLGAELAIEWAATLADDDVEEEMFHLSEILNW